MQKSQKYNTYTSLQQRKTVSTGTQRKTLGWLLRASDGWHFLHQSYYQFALFLILECFNCHAFADQSWWSYSNNSSRCFRTWIPHRWCSIDSAYSTPGGSCHWFQASSPCWHWSRERQRCRGTICWSASLFHISSVFSVKVCAHGDLF